MRHDLYAAFTLDPHICAAFGKTRAEGNVFDRKTFFAYEMGMGRCIVIEAFLTAENTERSYLAVCFENAEITVDSSEAEVGYLGLELLIDPFGGGVNVSRSDDFIDSFTLCTEIPLFTHRDHLKTVTILISFINIT